MKLGHNVLDLCIVSKQKTEFEPTLKVDYTIDLFPGTPVRENYLVLVTFSNPKKEQKNRMPPKLSNNREDNCGLSKLEKQKREFGYKRNQQPWVVGEDWMYFQKSTKAVN